MFTKVTNDASDAKQLGLRGRLISSILGVADILYFTLTIALLSCQCLFCQIHCCISMCVDVSVIVSPEIMDVDDGEEDEEALMKHSTSLTNKQRGNELTVLPATIDCKYVLPFQKFTVLFLLFFTCDLLSFPKLCPYTSSPLREISARLPCISTKVKHCSLILSSCVYMCDQWWMNPEGCVHFSRLFSAQQTR